MTDLPPELTARPISLIGLFGLDLSNPVHHSIWDAFNNRRPDSAAVQFKLFNSNHEFATVKPKVLTKMPKKIIFIAINSHFSATHMNGMYPKES